MAAKWLRYKTSKGKPAWKLPPYHWTAEPDRRWGEPSRGRIYADVNGFLDPVDFRGQLVTVVGPITGAVDGKIGNTPYKFMVMQVTGYKRWHLTQQVIMPPQPIDPWFYGGRGWPYGYGGWGWYNPGPARV